MPESIIPLCNCTYNSRLDYYTVISIVLICAVVCTYLERTETLHRVPAAKSSRSDKSVDTPRNPAIFSTTIHVEMRFRVVKYIIMF